MTAAPPELDTRKLELREQLKVLKPTDHELNQLLEMERRMYTGINQFTLGLARLGTIDFSPASQHFDPAATLEMMRFCE